jgi:flagellar biosynthesis/type III secretory pathway chaperone
MPPLNTKPSLPSSKEPAASPSLEHLMTRTIVLIDEIVTVLEEEIPLIETRKHKEHAELLKRKQRLTLDYRANLKSLIAEPELLKQLPESLRAKARIAAERLAEASGRNARALRAVITASQRLVQSIVAMVKDEVLPQTAYTNVQAGHMAGSYSPTCKPVTIFKTA